jgi:hypothetical protein
MVVRGLPPFHPLLTPWYVAPTYKQGKRIAWKPLKDLTRPYWAARPNETDLRIELISGGTICLRGADNYDSLRGDGLDFLVLDEYASIAREAWTEVLRPALADRQGRALFIGTPRGFSRDLCCVRLFMRVYTSRSPIDFSVRWSHHSPGYCEFRS